MARYTFGDDKSAVHRLRLVAAAYEPVSRAFLAAHIESPVGVAVDLGCGPGFSTRLLGQVSEAGELVGVDSSADFLGVARHNVPDASFLVADLSAPFAALPRADVLYARLLLAHMADPLGALARWQEGLAPGGRLLVEDLESVEAPPGPLRHYEEASAAMVRAAGGVMYGGAVAAPLGGELTAVTVPAVLAAEIYLFNVRRWAADPDCAGHRSELSQLETALTRVGDADGTVSWVVRQVALGFR